MKIVKLIALFLVVVVQLKGSEQQCKINFFTAIGEASQGFNPVILYEKYILNFLLQQFEDSWLKCRLHSQKNYDPKCLIISDEERQSDRKRSCVYIEIGEQDNDLGSLNNYNGIYRNNTITEMNSLNSDQLIECLKMQKDLVIFNMYRTGSSELNNLYLNEIETVMQKKVPVLIILGPEYKGIDIEQLCKNNRIEAIVYNKPTINNDKPMIKDISWWKNHEEELMLGGLFVGVILTYGIFCYAQFVR